MATNRKKQTSRGHAPRGRKSLPRERLANAAGFLSDAEVRSLFPETRQKPLNNFVNSLTELMAQAPASADAGPEALGPAYGALIRALAKLPPATHDSAKEKKSQSLAADTLRQMILESVSSALVMLPSILEDDTLSDKQKLAKLITYTNSLEDLYEPLQIEPVGEPGEETEFHPKEHESRKELQPGSPCIVRQIGLVKAGAVIRKAVVEGIS